MRPHAGLAALLAASSLPTMAQPQEKPQQKREPQETVVVESSLEIPAYHEPGLSGGVLYVDNDTLMHDSTDRDYTMGVQLSFSGAWIRRVHLPFLLNLVDKAWFRRFHERSCKDGECEHGIEVHDIDLGITAFTPRKGDEGDADCPGAGEHGCVLALATPVYNDRPYASIEFVTVRHLTSGPRTAFGSDLTLGWLGADLARRSQTTIHTWLKDKIPGGWSHQISNGGEPTAKYRMLVRHLAFWDGNLGDALRHFDLTEDSEANLGYYTSASVGARLRFGEIRSPFWAYDRRPIGPIYVDLRNPRLPPRPTPKRSQALDTTLTDPTKRGSTLDFLVPSEAYGWVSTGTTAWLYNALLHGQFRVSDVRLSFNPARDDPNVASPLNRFVGDLEAGGMLRWGRVALLYQWSLHTPLFQGPHQRNHRWGGFYLAIN